MSAQDRGKFHGRFCRSGYMGAWGSMWQQVHKQGQNLINQIKHDARGNTNCFVDTWTFVRGQVNDSRTEPRMLCQPGSGNASERAKQGGCSSQVQHTLLTAQGWKDVWIWSEVFWMHALRAQPWGSSENDSVDPRHAISRYLKGVDIHTMSLWSVTFPPWFAGNRRVLLRLLWQAGDGWMLSLSMGNSCAMHTGCGSNGLKQMIGDLRTQLDP